MKFSQLFESILSEDKFKDLNDKYKTDIENSDLADTIYKVKEADPTKTSKYLDWIYKMLFKTGDIKKAGSKLERLTPLIKEFEALCNKNQIQGNEKSIYNYNTIDDLEAKVKSYKEDDGNTRLTSSGIDARRTRSNIFEFPGECTNLFEFIRDELKKSGKDPDALKECETIIGNKKLVIAIPKTKQGAQAAGGGTDWCTSSEKEDENLFNRYNFGVNTVLYYIYAINENDFMAKVNSDPYLKRMYGPDVPVLNGKTGKPITYINKDGVKINIPMYVPNQPILCIECTSAKKSVIHKRQRQFTGLTIKDAIKIIKAIDPVATFVDTL